MQSVNNVTKSYRSIQNLLLPNALTKFYVMALVSNLTLSLDQGAYILGYICQGQELVFGLGQKCNKPKFPFLRFSGVVVTALIQLLLCCLLLISFHIFLSFILTLACTFSPSHSTVSHFPSKKHRIKCVLKNKTT